MRQQRSERYGIAGLALVACMSAGLFASAKAVPAASGTTSRLVGQWQRETTCQELVADLRRAGLGATVAQAWVGQTSSTGESSFKPGSPKPTLAHPCTGAIPRRHSHFFTTSGRFGSLDWKGGQVDDAPYRIVNAHTAQIGSGTPHALFRFTIRGGRMLSLSPMLTQAMIRQANAHPMQFSSAFWAVTVAYAGHTWKRVPCARCG
jgi:hypothetical protein